MLGWDTAAFVCLGGMIACIYLRQSPQDIQADPAVALPRIRRHWARVGMWRLLFEIGFAVATLAAVATDEHLFLWHPTSYDALITGAFIVAFAIFAADKIRQRRFIAIATDELTKQEVQADNSSVRLLVAVMVSLIFLGTLAVALAPTPQLRTLGIAFFMALTWAAVNYAAYWHMLRKPSATEKFPDIVATIESSGVKVTWIGWTPGPMFNALAMANNRILLMGPMSSMSKEEVSSIVAHELSHLRHNDIPRYRAWTRLSMLLGWLGFAGVLVWAGPTPTIAELLLALLATRVGILIAAAASGPGKKTLEFRADQEAAQLTSPELFASTLTKLHLRGGITDRWLPWESPFISHPPLEQRLERLAAMPRSDQVAVKLE